MPANSRWDLIQRLKPIPVGGRSLPGIVGYKSRRGKNVRLLWVLCVVTLRCLRRADHSSRGFLPTVVWLSVIVKPRKWGDPGRLGAIAPWGRGRTWYISFETINSRVIQSNTSFYYCQNTYIPSRQHVSATRSHHQASNIRTDLYLVFGVPLGSQLC